MNKHISIKYKLILIITGTCFVVLSAMGAALLLIDRASIKTAMHDQFVAIAKIIADQSTAALSFEDRDSATETLEAIALESSVVQACIFNETGNLFAVYARPGNPQCDSTVNNVDTYFSSDYLHVYQEILLDSNSIGTVYLEVSLEELQERFYEMLFIIVLLVLVSSIIALFLARYIQRIISRPILDLTAITREISEKGNYNITVNKESND